MVFNILRNLRAPVQKESVEQFVSELKELNKYTPDLSILEMYANHLLFVPDQFRRGYRDHKFISDQAEYKATAFTDDPMFFFIKDLGKESVPVALRHMPNHIGNYTHPARIKGELFKTTPELLKNLDDHRLNGVQFERKRVEILIPSRLLIYTQKKPVPHLSDVRIQTVSCWMYLGVPEYWNNLIGGIFPAKTARLVETNKWISEYYFYAKGNEL